MHPLLRQGMYFFARHCIKWLWQEIQLYKFREIWYTEYIHFDIFQKGVHL